MNMNMREHDEDWISALADGQLHDDAFASAVARLGEQPDARQTWAAYHLVGEVLRSGESGAVASDDAFVSRFRARLQAEPVVTATVQPLVQPVVVNVDRTPDAANEPMWRWKLVAGIASFAAILAVAWNVTGQSSTGGAQLAQQTLSAPPVQLAAGEPQQVMLRDPRLDELLAAHKQDGAASALQMPSGFLRNATFETPAR